MAETSRLNRLEAALRGASAAGIEAEVVAGALPLEILPTLTVPVAVAGSVATAIFPTTSSAFLSQRDRP